MNPFQPQPPGLAPSYTQDEMREDPKKLDDAITDQRATLDGLARGRKYSDLAMAADVLKTQAPTAEALRKNLDYLMATEAERKKRGW